MSGLDSIDTRSTNRQFAHATDAELMRPRLEGLLAQAWGRSVTLERLFVTRVFPRKQDGFVIQYELRIESEDTESPGSLLLCGHLSPLPESRLAYEGQTADKMIVMDDIDLFVPVFPYDPELASIDDVISSSLVAKSIGQNLETLGIGPEQVISCSYQVMGYRLGRRCVLGLEFPGARKDRPSESGIKVILKLLRPKQAKKMLKAAELLTAAGLDCDAEDHSLLPGILWSDRKRGIVLMECVPGRSVHDLVGSSEYHDSCRAAGEILARLHSHPVVDLPSFGAEQELANANLLTESIGSIFDRMMDKVKPALTLMAEHGPATVDQSHTACNHRDFYDKQVHYSSERTTLLDWDTMATGDPAQDIGNFEAHLYLRSLQQPDKSDSIRKGVAAFRQGYGAVDRIDHKRIRWWRAMALLRLSMLYLMRPRWRHLSLPLLNQSVSTMET